MRKQRAAIIAGFFLGINSSWLVVAGGYSGATSEASCPPLLGIQGWFPNTVQNYVAVTFTGQELNRINQAMGNWTLHNVGLNCSNVTLFPSAFGSYAINSTTGFDPLHPDWGAASQPVNTSGGHIIAEITTFYWGAHTPSVNV